MASQRACLKAFEMESQKELRSGSRMASQRATESPME
jgi:hypothetical protein